MHDCGGLTERLAAVLVRWPRLNRNFVSGAAYDHDCPLQSTTAPIRNDAKKAPIVAKPRVSLRRWVIRLEGPLSPKTIIQDQEQTSLDRPMIG